MKNIKIFLLLLVFSVFTVACSSKSESGASSEEKAGSESSVKKTDNTLIIGLDDDPPQLDPHRSSAAVDRQVFHSLFNTLIDIDENLEFVPELAKEWTISEDELTYTLKLQEGVQFQDGTPFNAEAVKFNFDRMLDPNFSSPRLSEINLVSAVNVIDEYTVEIVLSKPYAPFLANLTDRAGMMVSPTAVKKLGDNFANQPVGTGPYKFVERVPQSHIKLTRFDGYWGEKPSVENVEFRPFSDSTVRITNLVSGDLDLVNKVAFKDIDKLKKDPNIKLMEKDALGFQGIHLNTSVEPFNNKAVRQAVNLAIDREAIAEVVFHNGAVPSVSPFAPMSWAAPDFKQPKADVKKAKQILADAGLKNISFTLKLSPSPEEEQMAQMIQSMLKQVGIDMKIEMVEFGALLDQLDSGDFQAVRNGWSGRIDPDGNTYRFFYSGASNNYTRYSNPEVDTLLDKARTIGDQKQRAEMYKEVSDILWDDAPYIFIYHEIDYKAMKSYVKGFKHIPDTMIRTDSISFE
ncbi:ABC transporter substrate-binding protein [Neobacillus muris]|uniref:ABC transporter substrate-binding protein n=1 Tax=Neobacillus muris TaxID=2941334 RepID=UPI00203A3FB1|nr:ABC transporter substrate-binding protein [Neobacillus muris]